VILIPIALAKLVLVLVIEGKDRLIPSVILAEAVPENVNLPTLRPVTLFNVDVPEIAAVLVP